jgi:hypothetical protein
MSRSLEGSYKATGSNPMDALDNIVLRMGSAGRSNRKGDDGSILYYDSTFYSDGKKVSADHFKKYGGKFDFFLHTELGSYVITGTVKKKSNKWVADAFAEEQPF